MLLGCINILNLSYRDAWLALTDVWSTLIDVWLTLIVSLLFIRYPYKVIFSFPWWNLFGQLYEDKWLALVVYLMALTSNLILGHIFLFFKYSWDWNSYQLDFKLSTSLGFRWFMISRPSYMVFFDIEMDHIRFHLRSIDGFFNRVSEIDCFCHTYFVDWVIQEIRFQMSCDVHTLRFIFWKFSIKHLLRHIKSSFGSKFSEVWYIEFWLFDSSRWLIHQLFQQYENPKYWGIFPFPSLMVRPLEFEVYNSNLVSFLSIFKSTFFFFPSF